MQGAGIMKKKYIVVILLLFILCGCSIYDKELKIDYEAIKEEKPHDIEEGSEIQKEETLIHNENTVVNQMEKPYDNEIKNYQDYSGFWTEGGISHEELLQNGGVELYIEIINNNELHGYLYAQQGMTERIAEVENILCVIENGKCQYSFSDDGWGDSGTLFIQFEQEEIVIEVKDYKLSETNVIGFGIDRTYILTRAQNKEILENGSNFSVFESQTAELEQYKPNWTEEQILEEFSKRIKYFENCEYYEDVLHYMEGVREVTDSDLYINSLYATDTKYYSKEDFQDVPPLIIYLAKNEIYARHGYIFKDENLNNYFKGQLWYIPLISAEEFDGSIFNEYERENLKLLAEIDNYRK